MYSYSTVIELYCIECMHRISPSFCTVQKHVKYRTVELSIPVSFVRYDKSKAKVNFDEPDCATPAAMQFDIIGKCMYCTVRVQIMR